MTRRLIDLGWAAVAALSIVYCAAVILFGVYP